MRQYSKLFLIALIISFAAIPATAEQTDTEEKPKGMQSWAPTPKTENKKAKKSSSDTKTEKEELVTIDDLTPEERAVLEEIDNELAKEETEKKSNKKLSPEEKLWKKYSDLAKDNAKKEKEETSEKEEKKKEKSKDVAPASAKEDKESNADSKEEKAEDNGMMGILKRYKESQEGKGKMNSRSFGNID